ncbi:MAG TPA: hypothetical protein VEZ12_08350 [Herpetosiphonaceae bacterium]|jgi:hypothetical protein|nr:hypothetical protein [Herpetosiphonaceae bacterium]
MQDAFILFGCVGGLVATRIVPFFNALTARGLRILAIDLPSATVF